MRTSTLDHQGGRRAPRALGARLASLAVATCALLATTPLFGTGCTESAPSGDTATSATGTGAAAAGTGAATTATSGGSGSAVPRHVGAAVVLPSGSRPPAPAGALLDASRMVTTADLRPLASDGVTYTAARLAGIPRSGAYDSVHLRPPAPATHHGVAVQIWVHSSVEAARSAYDRDLSRYPKAEAAGDVGSASFRAYRASIQYLHYLSERHRVIVSVTCAVALCVPGAAPTADTATLEWDRLVALAGKTLKRLDAVVPAGTK